MQDAQQTTMRQYPVNRLKNENYPFYGDGTSERLFRDGLCLPSGSNLTEEDMIRIFEVFNTLLK